MATVTKSIKATGGDYTTPALWEADLDSALVYIPTDDAVGELYDESYSWTTLLAIDGGGTIGLNSVTLSVAAGERSSGVAGTGARITATATIATTFISLVPIAGSNKLIVEYFEINGNGQTTTSFIASTSATAGRIPIIRYVMLHDGTNTTANNRIISASGRDVLIHNSIMYDYVMSANNRSLEGILTQSTNAAGGQFNNIIYGLVAHNTGIARGIQTQADDVDCKVRNNIVAGLTGNPVGFTWVGAVNVVSSNNLSDDATADDGGGSGHVINATTADLFVSTTGGSEDFSPQDASAPQVDLGVDLVTTPTGVNLDFKGRDRDAQGDTWDIGAIEFVGAGATPTRRRVGRGFRR